MLLAPQNVGNFVVRRGDANLTINDEQDQVRFLNCKFGLFSDLVDEILGANGKGRLVAVLGRVDPAGIHHIKVMAGPFRFRKETITRRTGHVIHNRQPFAGQAVEEGALTNIRTAHQGHNRFCHRW